MFVNLLNPSLSLCRPFMIIGKSYMIITKKADINAAAVKAHILLANHSVANIAPAILGAPVPELVHDYKFQPSEAEHVRSGEKLAQAALQTEYLVCAVARVAPCVIYW